MKRIPVICVVILPLVLVLASCGGDDTSALRAEVAALQTQVAQPTPTPAPPSPTEPTREVATPATPAPQPKPTVVPQAAAPAVQQPPAPTPVPAQPTPVPSPPCTNIVLQNGTASPTDAQIRALEAARLSQAAALESFNNRKSWEASSVPSTNLPDSRASTIQTRSNGQITTLEGVLRDKAGTYYAVGSRYPEGGFPR